LHAARTPTSTYSYKTFGSGTPLQIYEFDPDTSGTYPALVLVYGGGWSSGSGTGVSGLAHELATGKQHYKDANGNRIVVNLSQKFIVLAV